MAITSKRYVITESTYPELRAVADGKPENNSMVWYSEMPFCKNVPDWFE